MESLWTLLLLTLALAGIHSAPYSSNEEEVSDLLLAAKESLTDMQPPWSPSHSLPYPFSEKTDQQRNTASLSKIGADTSGEPEEEALKIFLFILNFIQWLEKYIQDNFSPSAAIPSGKEAQIEEGLLRGLLFYDLRRQQVSKEQVNDYSSESQIRGVIADRSSAMDVVEVDDEIYAAFEEINQIAAQILHRFADVFYENFEKEFGIDSPELIQIRRIACTFHLIADKTKLGNFEIDDDTQETFKFAIKTIFSAFDKLTHLSNKNGVPKAIAKTEQWDVIFPLFQYYQGLWGDRLLNEVFKHDPTMTDEDKRILKDFQSVIAKLYDTETLTDEKDKVALNHILQQANR